MANTLLPMADDEDEKKKKSKHKNLKAKKEKVIQPIDKEGNTKSSKSSSGEKVLSPSDDLLAELREKTAQLAEEVSGDDLPANRTLNLDDGKDTTELAKEIEEEVEEVVAQEVANPKKSEIHKKKNDSDPAVQLVRDKLAKIYEAEPDANEEAVEAYQAGKKRTKHQQFMYDLTTSGKSLADIQTEWHNYYVALPDDEKHTVWKEFYDAQNSISKPAKKPTKSAKKSSPKKESVKKKPMAYSSNDKRSAGDIKAQIMNKVNAGGKLKASHHAKSLLFGFGLASVVALLISFTFFNEVFIAPFISPSKSVSATPIIGDQTGPVGPEPKIIIPKINLEVPVVFGLNSIAEADIQNALEDGVVHYSTTPNPGEKGNSVIVGHSSNNILNSGKYKFAFVLLKRLEIDDTFFVHKDGVRYTYKVYEKKIVPPTDVSVLKTQDKPNTMTLITCDPPGTSINRLIVVGEQISPDPSGNKESTAPNLVSEGEGASLPSNAPSLWSRLWPF